MSSVAPNPGAPSRGLFAFQENHMSKKTVKVGRSAPKATKALVLFGLDESGKPRAARFPADQADLVTRAARSMALRLGVATTPEHFEVVNKLPAGRIHTSG